MQLNLGYAWMFEPNLMEFFGWKCKKVTMPEYWLFIGGSPHLNFLRIKMSPCLNVCYLWWWKLTPQCFKCTKVTSPECWLFVVVGISLNALSAQMSPCLNVGYLFRWGPLPECFKYKTSPQLNVVFRWWWPMSKCFKCKKDKTPECWLFVMVVTNAWKF